MARLKLRLTPESQAALEAYARERSATPAVILQELLDTIANAKSGDWRPSDSPSPAGARVFKFEQVKE